MVLTEKITNSYGRVLVPYGIQTTMSEYYIHVSFGSDMCLYVYYVAVVLPIIKQRVVDLKDLTFGSRPGVMEKETGAGCNLLPDEMKATSIPLDNRWMAGRDPRAAATGYFRWLGYKNIRDASRAEQNSGIDYILTTTQGMEQRWELKSRDRYYERLFVQTHERNPERRYT